MTAGIRRIAIEQRLWTWGGSKPTDTPDIRLIELTVGDATLVFTPDEVVGSRRALVSAWTGPLMGMPPTGAIRLTAGPPGRG